jgi:hypothetical protein
MTYPEALKIATELHWTETASFITGVGSGRRGYSVHQISDKHPLISKLKKHEMDQTQWKQKIIAAAGVK